jgi:hypothetical protein
LEALIGLREISSASPTAELTLLDEVAHYKNENATSALILAYTFAFDSAGRMGFKRSHVLDPRQTRDILSHLQSAMTEDEKRNDRTAYAREKRIFDFVRAEMAEEVVVA